MLCHIFASSRWSFVLGTKHRDWDCEKSRCSCTQCSDTQILLDSCIQDTVMHWQVTACLKFLGRSHQEQYMLQRYHPNWWTIKFFIYWRKTCSASFGCVGSRVKWILTNCYCLTVHRRGLKTRIRIHEILQSWVHHCHTQLSCQPVWQYVSGEVMFCLKYFADLHHVI